MKIFKIARDKRMPESATKKTTTKTKANPKNSLNSLIREVCRNVVAHVLYATRSFQF